MEFTDEELSYLTDALMVFMHEIDALDHDDNRLPDLQQLLIKLMFTDDDEPYRSGGVLPGE
jgi:hypothetical protein